MVLSVHRQDGALSMVRSHLEHGDRVHQAYNHIQVKYIETVFGERIASLFILFRCEDNLGLSSAKDDKYPDIPETAWCTVRCCISIQMMA